METKDSVLEEMTSDLRLNDAWELAGPHGKSGERTSWIKVEGAKDLRNQFGWNLYMNQVVRDTGVM